MIVIFLQATKTFLNQKTKSRKEKPSEYFLLTSYIIKNYIYRVVRDLSKINSLIKMAPNSLIPFISGFSVDSHQLDCSNYAVNDVRLAYWIYIGASIFITLGLSFAWLLRKEWFPLKERSPLLVWTTLVGNLLIQLSFPVVFLYQDSIIADGGFSKYLLFSFIHLGNLSLFIPYVWRALRLHYAFNIDHRNKRMEGIYSRQYIMFLMTIAIAIVYSVLMLTLFQENSLPFYQKEKSASLVTFTVTTGVYFIEMCLMALTAYMLRHVKDEYNFNKEIIFVVSTVFVTFNFIAYYYDEMKDCKFIAFPEIMMVINLRGWLIIYVTALRPLFRATKLHYLLAQKFVIDIFQNFLGDETCIKAFDGFIKEGKNREGSFLHEPAPFPPNDEIELFRVFISLRERIISEISTPKIITRMMKDFIWNRRVADLFPETYIFEIKQQYETNKDNMTVESFDKLHGFCIYYFQAVFEARFRRTKSFQYIKEQFGKNEQINRRLHKLKLISIR